MLDWNSDIISIQSGGYKGDVAPLRDRARVSRRSVWVVKRVVKTDLEFCDRG